MLHLDIPTAARGNQGRATTDLASVARAATMGAVDTMPVDIDAVVPGTVDETDGTITRSEAEASGHDGIVDEIARRALPSGARVLGVRKANVAGGEPLAAILRSPM